MPLPTYRQKEFWLDVRTALLMLVDAIERLISITPRTMELRKMFKEKSAINN